MKVLGVSAWDVGERNQSGEVQDVGSDRIDAAIGDRIVQNRSVSYWIKELYRNANRVSARIASSDCRLREIAYTGGGGATAFRDCRNRRKGVIWIIGKRAVVVQEKERLCTAVVDFGNIQRTAQVCSEALLEISGIGRWYACQRIRRCVEG